MSDEESKENSNIDENLSDFHDWEKKYDICLEMLKNEYVQAVEGIKNTDEKANKYLVILSLIFTAIFAILSSSLINGLSFSTSTQNLVNLISLLFVGLLIRLFYLTIKILHSSLKVLELQECYKISALSDALAEYGEVNSTEFKHELISRYEIVINSYAEAKKNKQKGLDGMSLLMKKTYTCLCLILSLLFVIKILTS